MSLRSKTVYTGDVIVQPLIPSENRTDFLMDAVFQSVLGEQEITKVLGESITDSLASKANLVHDLANRRYTRLRSPSVDFIKEFNTPAQEIAIRNVLQGIHSAPVSLRSIFIGFPNPESLAQQVLINDYNMDLVTGVIPKPIEESNEGTQTFERAIFQGNTIRIYYDLDGEQKSFIHDAFAIGFTELYITAEYQVFQETSNRIWNYNTNSGLYPEIEIFRDRVNEEFYPTLPVREDYNNIVEGHPLRESSENLLQYLGIDIDEVLDGLNGDGTGSTNPGSEPPNDNYVRGQEVNAGAVEDESAGQNIPEEIQDAFITFQADLTSEDAYTLDYLFRYFNKERQTQSNIISNIYRYIVNNNRNLPPSDSPLWGDTELRRDIPPLPHTLSFTSNVMHKNILYNFIDFEEVEGIIGILGTVKRELDIREDFIVYDPDVPGNLRELYRVSLSNYIIKKQVSQNTYHVITVNGLYMVEDVHDREDVVRLLADVDEGEEGFTIPVSKTLLDSVSNVWVRSQILQSTCVAVVYAVSRQRVRWYRRRAFAKLIQIAAVAITVFTGGAGAPALTWAFAVQVATQIIINIAIGVALQFALSVVANIIGYEAAMILAVAATAFAIYSGAFATDPSLPWAGDLLKLSTMSFDAIQENMVIDFQKELDEFTNFQKEIEARYDEIDEINQMLRGDNPNLTETITRVNQISLWETPAMFYSRTVENKNPGTAAIEAISVYVERKLQLPKPEDFLYKPA